MTLPPDTWNPTGPSMWTTDPRMHGCWTKEYAAFRSAGNDAHAPFHSKAAARTRKASDIVKHAKLSDIGYTKGSIAIFSQADTDRSQKIRGKL